MTPSVPALLMAALGVGILTGCPADKRPTPVPTPSGPPDPDVEYLRLAVLAELALLSSYDDPAAPADLAPFLAEARTHHQDHLAALVEVARASGLPVPSTVSPSPAAPSPGAPPPRGPQLSPPKDAVDLARRLVALERRSSDWGLSVIPAVRRPEVALLAAQVAASEAQHATALFTALREGLVRRVPRPTPTVAPTSP